MPKGKSPEMDAVQAVYGALKPLEPEVRTQVLDAACALLGMKSPSAVEKERKDIPDRPGTGGRAQGGRPLSLRELMNEKQPATRDQMIVLFAYYRERHEGKPRFGRNDLEGYFAMAKEQPPGNYDRDFVSAVKKGWIHEDGQESYITSKGIEAVEAGFGGKRKSPAKKTPSTRRKK